jgi:hypothetical protein
MKNQFKFWEFKKIALSLCVYGTEIDFVMTWRNRIFALECKASYTPILSKSNYNAIEDIAPEKTFVISPIAKGWKMKHNIELVSIKEMIEKLQYNTKIYEK